MKKLIVINPEGNLEDEDCVMGINIFNIPSKQVVDDSYIKSLGFFDPNKCDWFIASNFNIHINENN